MKKILEIFKWIVFIGVPILYYIVEYQQNILMDIAWVYTFALLTKEFIMKVLLKEKYCEIDLKEKKES